MRTFLFSIVFGFTMLLLFPVASYAAGIVPCDGVSVNGGVVCQTCHFVELGSNILNWIVGVMATVCAVVIAVAGLKMATAGGNAGAVSAAKEMITNTIVGFIILLSAWLIVDTVMRVFVGDQVPNFGPWNEIQCVSPQQVYPDVTPSTPPVSDACASASNPQACMCEATPGNVWDLGNGVCIPGSAPQTGTLTHAEALAQLSGVTVVSSGNCTDRTNPRCTSLDGIQQGALNEILGTINGCTGCNLQITAGTEVGHTNQCHVNGTCVDIRCAGGCSSTQILSIHDAARSNGARVVYETISCAARDAARAQGITAYCQSDPGYGHITGDHFSLYTQ